MPWTRPDDLELSWIGRLQEAVRMEITSESVICPVCGAHARVDLIRQIDRHGFATSHELEFTCPRGHRVAPDRLRALLAAQPRTRG